MPTNDDEMIPAYVLDIFQGIYEDQMNKAIKQQEEAIERLRYHDTQDWAHWTQILLQMKEILLHPNGGPDVLIKFIDKSIAMMRQFDQEE